MKKKKKKKVRVVITSTAAAFAARVVGIFCVGLYLGSVLLQGVGGQTNLGVLGGGEDFVVSFVTFKSFLFYFYSIV